MVIHVCARSTPSSPIHRMHTDSIFRWIEYAVAAPSDKKYVDCSSVARSLSVVLALFYLWNFWCHRQHYKCQFPGFCAGCLCAHDVGVCQQIRKTAFQSIIMIAARFFRRKMSVLALFESDAWLSIQAYCCTTNDMAGYKQTYHARTNHYYYHYWGGRAKKRIGI